LTVLVPEVVEKEVQEETNKVVAAANAVVVDSNEGMQEATNILSWIAGAKKQIEAKRVFFTKPLRQQVEAINAMFKDYVAPLEQADKTLRGKILTYRHEQERIRRAEQEHMQKLLEKEQKRLEKQAEKRGMPPPPPVVAPVVEAQPKTVRSEMGAVSAKKVWDFEIEDADKIPRAFMIPNEKAIRAAVKAGVRSLPGVRIFQREGLSVRAR